MYPIIPKSIYAGLMVVSLTLLFRVADKPVSKWAWMVLFILIGVFLAFLIIDIKNFIAKK